MNEPAFCHGALLGSSFIDSYDDFRCNENSCDSTHILCFNGLSTHFIQPHGYFN